MAAPHEGEYGIIVEEVLYHLSYPIHFDIPNSIKMLYITSLVKELHFTSECCGSSIVPTSEVCNV
jgi:hypothetical protein